MKAPLLVTLSAGIGNAKVDTVNAVIRGVSVITSGLVARGHDLAVDSTTLSQMLACAEEKGQVPVKVDHKSGAAAVCGYLDNFRLSGTKLKADWHLLQSHPQKDQILEVAERMPSGVGLSASFIAPDTAEAGKARCKELLSVDYVAMPAANPDGMFARREDPDAVRAARVAKVKRVVGAGAVAVTGALGAAGLAAHGVDRVGALGIRGLQPSQKVRAGILGAAGALGAAQALRAVSQGRKPARYDDRREMAADFAAALIGLGMTTAEAKRHADELAQAEQERGAPRVVIVKPHPSFKRRVLTRAAKIGVGAAGGAYIGRKLGTAAGATTGALAGVLFQSSHARNAVRVGLNFASKHKTTSL